HSLQPRKNRPSLRTFFEDQDSLSSAGRDRSSARQVEIVRPFDRQTSQETVVNPAHVPEPVNDFGGGLMIWPPGGDTPSTASPRWLVPSGRKRNNPSMPVKPDEVVSTASAKRCLPWVLTRAAISATAS